MTTIYEAFGIGRLFKKFKDMFDDGTGYYNDLIINTIAKEFTPQFAKFFSTYAKKIYKGYDLATFLYNLQQAPASSQNQLLWMEMVGVPMVDFFLTKAFGVGEKFRRMIPFSNNTSTGNKALDKIIQNTLSDSLGEADMQKLLLIQLKKTLNDKLNSLFSDAKIKTILSDLSNPDNNDLQSEGIFDMFRKKSVNTSIELLNETLKYLPVKRELRNFIKNEFMQSGEMNLRKSKSTAEIVTNMLARPILKYVALKALKLYIDNNADFKPLKPILVKIFTAPALVELLAKRIRENLEEVAPQLPQVLADLKIATQRYSGAKPKSKTKK